MAGRLSKVLAAILVLVANLSVSQNLVPNSSFECGIDVCEPNTYPFTLNACGWNCPNKSTPDIFTTQLQNKGCYSSVPYNGTDPYLHYGSQIPRTGNRFAGIYAWDGPGKTLYREYLQVKLTSPLIPGEYYCTEMFVSRAEMPLYGANNLGMYFSDQEVKVSDSYSNLPYSPQIVEHKIISDTVNWVRVSGTFKATSPAQYLIIGNFSDNDNTITSYHGDQNHHDDYYAYAFFFIDDIKVEKLPYGEFVFSGNTSICKGESSQIIAEVGVNEVKWSMLPDTTTVIHIGKTISVSPPVTTSYRVKAQSCNLTIIDTIKVNVFELPTVNLGKDSTICQNKQLIIDAGSGFKSYKWQDGSNNQTFTPIFKGKYSVEVTDFNNCVGRDEIEISVLSPPVIDLGNDTLTCDSFFPLKAYGKSNHFLWSTNSIDSVILPARAGKYWVSVSNRCGNASDTINIYSMSDIFIPNVVTPNDDPYNERFTFTGIGNSYSAYLKIFDRWGNQIYSRNNYHSEWPLHSEVPEGGTFYYILEFPDCRTYKGWIQVLKK
ncbi:MAG: gliding motility-associated C-terminal domain-containing protein [Cyclobacteriaceae bacterium]|jgi:gliding motility-associated-like protein